MTKQAINPITLLEVTVEDEITVKTVNGVHYLLTTAEQDAETAKEIAYTAGADDRQKDALRATRVPLLTEADHQIFKHEDKAVDESTWRTYRDALRDVTDAADIYDVTWPTKPTVI